MIAPIQHILVKIPQYLVLSDVKKDDSKGILKKNKVLKETVSHNILSLCEGKTSLCEGVI